MNDFRRDLVERVFVILDKNNDGGIDMNEITSSFNGKRHPEVLNGRKSEQQVFLEFI